MKKCTLILFSLCFTLMAFAQNASITGKLVDPSGQALSYANAVLYAADSTMVKGAFTDDKGGFVFDQLKADRYYVQTSFLGYETQQTKIFELAANEAKQIPQIQLEEAGQELAAVTVTAQRPLMELKPDKMVFNVDGSINATGNTALELLRKSPGVVVDNNDNINIMGKSGVRVYIDGRPSPLSGDDLANFLRNMQSDQIDAIEVITNPSSKYDAEGNGGIINIKLKKNKKHGANASVNLGYSIGIFGRYNASINTNYRNEKWNIYGNLSAYQGMNHNIQNIGREQFGLRFDNRGHSISEWKGMNIKVGTDYFIDKKQTVGVQVSGNINDSEYNSTSRTPISMIGQNYIDSILVSGSYSNAGRLNWNTNVNYSFDNGKGKTLSIDADYGVYDRTNEDFQPNAYMDATEEIVLNERNFWMETPNNIAIATFKTDYEQPLGKGKLGTGLKTSFVKTDNTFDFYNIVDGINEIDLGRSNQFIYTENVNAAYANYKAQAGKIGYQLGLRMEQTNSEGDLIANQDTDDKNVKRSYLDWFPSAGLTYQMNKKNSFQLSYSRRISRPTYQDLNPFEGRLDELTYEQGNPFLKPEYSNVFQLTHSFNYSLNTTLMYSHATDLITRLTEAADERASYITWINLQDQYNYSLNLSSPIPIKEWWSSYTSLTAYHQRNKADNGEGKTIDIKATAFNAYMQHTFKLPKGINMELSGWYNSPALWGGTFQMEQMYSIDFGIKKKILNDRGSIKFAVSDIFRSSGWRGTSDYAGLHMFANGNWDSRRFRINFSYLFGNDKVKSRKRRTASEEEAKRIKSDN